MIVEDEPLVTLLLADMLTAMDCEVCASEGTEADVIAAALRISPELIVVDASLHEGSGVVAVEKVLRNGFIAHIFMSADRLFHERLHLRAVSIRKPFSKPI